jgi:hypothetical protein
MQHTAHYYLVTFSVAVVAFGPPVIIAHKLGLGITFQVLSSCIFGFAISLPVDRMIDNSWRGTAQIGNKEMPPHA